MLLRGAKNFTFLNRTGVRREGVKELIEELRSGGAEVNVVRGDISVLSDVKKMISRLSGPVGGIIHAAMGLQVS